MPSDETPAATPHPRGLQFSLGAMLAAISVIAIICAALANPTPLWNGVLATCVVLMLLVAALVVIYRTGPLRTFAVGFLLFGCVYGFLGNHNVVPFKDPTNDASNWLYAHLHPEQWHSMATQRTAFEGYSRFTTIFRSSTVIAVAILGGVVALAIKATERRHNSMNTS